jgi:predicted HAD superfamily Cof-like phosphohydrolase
MNYHYIPSEAKTDRRPAMSATKTVELNAAELQLGTFSRSYAAQVLQFMIAFDQHPTPVGEPVSKETFRLGEKLIEEEIREFQEGWNKFEVAQTLENAAEMLDGAADAIYVILWAMNKFGLPFDAVFAEVQRSNMAKLQPDGSYKKNEHGKVQKPENWTPPDIVGVLMRHTDTATWNGNIRTGDK